MTRPYTACLIIIGNEILSGRTQDKLGTCGITFNEVRIIPDHEPRIIHTVNEVHISHDFVITTGGIDPTHDDITNDDCDFTFQHDYSAALNKKLLASSIKMN